MNKDLVLRTKKAFDNHCYIETISLSHLLIFSSLKLLCKSEGIKIQTSPPKFNDYLKAVKTTYSQNPELSKKFKKSAFNRIVEFNSEYRKIMKQLKFQYPEIKIMNTAKNGMNTITIVNTELIKLRSNKKN